jgi:hypothetical protein
LTSEPPVVPSTDKGSTRGATVDDAAASSLTEESFDVHSSQVPSPNVPSKFDDSVAQLNTSEFSGLHSVKRRSVVKYNTNEGVVTTNDVEDGGNFENIVAAEFQEIELVGAHEVENPRRTIQSHLVESETAGTPIL